MTPSISDGLPVQLAQTPAPAQTTSNQATQPQPAEDTIAFSEAAQIILLNTQGMTASAISEDLGISTSVVDSDLEIISTAVSSAPPALPSATAPASTTQAETLFKTTSTA